MKTAMYRRANGNKIEIEYDENAPCIVCGEPVLGASMGGTNICGSCDCGKCRYCKMTIFVIKPELDGGRSKKAVLDHMKWHKKETPDLVKRTNKLRRAILEHFERTRKKDPQKILERDDVQWEHG